MLPADEFWLVAHDDRTGKARLGARACGLALAAALLGEVAIYRKIEIRQGYIHVVDRQPPPDSLVHDVLDQIAAEVELHTVRTWLTFLSRTAEAQVAKRLVRTGQVTAETTRKLLKQTTSYVPVDANAATWPRARISVRLRQLRPMEYTDAFLAGLAVATGLDRQILDGADPESRRYLDHVLSTQWQPLRDLVSHCQAAIGDAVLSHRN